MKEAYIMTSNDKEELVKNAIIIQGLITAFREDIKFTDDKTAKVISSIEVAAQNINKILSSED